MKIHIRKERLRMDGTEAETKHGVDRTFYARRLWEWGATRDRQRTFLEVMDYLERSDVPHCVIFYFSESGDRVKQRQYRREVGTTSQGKGEAAAGSRPCRS